VAKSKPKSPFKGRWSIVLMSAWHKAELLAKDWAA
jgi:hypothetical protein